MKKHVWLILLMCLLMASCSSAEEALPTQGETLPAQAETLPVQEEALLAPGEVIAGFRVTSIDRIEYQDTDVVYMEHEKSGAQLIYFANDDLERSFSIGFRTNAETDQGIPHVFEHSTLSGSAKYPDPNLLFNMMSQTYNTYINALTYPTVTIFPCASLSEDQLYRFVDYYMAGVTQPLILTDERAMMREAYRYSLTDADAEIGINGVVYNEMKGSLSTPVSMALSHMNKVLYPGSVKGNESGGIPEDILTITHQQLKDFHARYYHPSNSLITLYGKMDVERFLKLLDESYLSGYERMEIVIDDPAYEPYEGHREKTWDFPVAAGTSAQNAALLSYGIAMNGCTPEETILAEVVATAMNLQSSKLQQLVQEKLPGVYVEALVLDYTPVPTMMFAALYANPEDQAVFEEIVKESIASLAETGISESVYEMLINSIKTQQLMSSEGTNIGISQGLDFTEKWSHAGHTDAALKAINVSLNIEQYAQSGAIDAIVTKYLAAPTQTASSITRPVPGLKEEQDAALMQELAAMKNAMSEEEIQALIDETAAFDAWTQDNAESTMINEIKVVDAQTLPEEVQTANVTDETVDGIRYISSFVAEEGFVIPSFYFDASVIPADRLHDYALYATLLGALDTQDYSREELQEHAKILMNKTEIKASTIGYEDGSYQPVLTAGWSALSENLEESYALMESILLRTDFSDLEYIRSYLTKSAADMRLTYSSQTPHSLAVTIGRAALNEQSLYSYRIGALDFLAYLEEVIAMNDEQLGALMQSMDEIRDLLMNRNGLIISCVGNEEIIADNTALARSILDQLATEQQESVDYTDALEPLPDSIAVMVEGSVQYNAMVAGMPAGSTKDGRYSAMGSLVDDLLLLPYLRFENGAYSVMTGITDKDIYVVSFRDPNYALTYDYYHQLGDKIRGLSLEQTDLDGYITTAYSSLAMPEGPYTLASDAAARVMRGETDETLNQMRQLKTFCVEDLELMAGFYDLLQSGIKVTVGSPSLILENAEDFDLILDGLINQSGAEEVPAA